MGGPGTLTASQRHWLAVRSYLQAHRHRLTCQAADGYPASRRVGGTPLLAAPGWLPAVPVPLGDIRLELGAAGLPPRPATGTASFLAERPDGSRYRSYSAALRDLAPPAVLQNRATYRLTEADLAAAAPRLAFTRGRYFDGIDTGEAAAHEFAAARMRAGRAGPADPEGADPDGADPEGADPDSADAERAGAGRQSLRARVGDPCDLRRRPANLAISTLTLRLDRCRGRASFLLHWRDPARVGHAGGLQTVVPVGVFQPSGEAGWNTRPDFSLWRGMIREFAEEVGGGPEDYGSEAGPVDYDSWPLARQMSAARAAGQLRVWCLGLGTDPLTWATDLLTVAAFDADAFDALFTLRPRRNEEGRVLAARDFEAHVIDRLTDGEPVQAATAAVLRLAWAHRELLTG